MRLHGYEGWDESLYVNPFRYYDTEREGQLLVRSNDTLTLEGAKPYTFKFSMAFFERLEKVCSGPSLSFILAWLINDAVDECLRTNICMRIHKNHVVGIQGKISYYICDCRTYQVSDSRYKTYTMPIYLPDRVAAHVIGKSKAVCHEKLAGYRLDMNQEKNKTSVVFRV